MEPELEIPSNDNSTTESKTSIEAEPAQELAATDPDLATTQRQDVSGESVSWLDDMDVSVADRPGADPFWAAVSAISDRLTIQKRIGKGGMSVVYKAFHQTMHKRVAVKLLLPHLTADPTTLKRFQLEAQATANLNHPNVVRIYDCGMAKGQAFIIMDFIEGDSLEQVVDREGKLKPDRAIDLFIQLCEGIGHAHERGIIHRDLKPSNVMISTFENEVEQVKVVDFGIAKLLFDDDGSTMQKLTQTGEVFGSPLYMSPEQCSGQKLDSRSDIYSVGCLMYEALSGRPPIAGRNSFDTMQRHCTDLPKPYIPENSGNSLAKRLQTIVFKCMAKEPSSRYQSMDDIVGDLKLIKNPDGTRGGIWKEREKSLSDIVHKAGKKARIIRNSIIAAITLSIVAAGFASNQYIAQLNTPSGYETKALFSLIDVPKPKYSDADSNFQDVKRNLLLDLDRIDGPLEESEKEGGFETVAQTYMDYGKWTEAQALYKKLIGMPVGRMKLGAYYLEIGKCNLALCKLEDAKQQFEKAATLDLDAQNGYQRGDDHPNANKLLGGIYGAKARPALAYLALIEEQQNNLAHAEQYAQSLMRSARATDSDSPAETAYDADLKRRLHKYADAVYLFQRLKLSDSAAPERDYRTKIDFALGLCHIASNEAEHAVADFDDALKAGATDADLLAAIDHEFHRALWLAGDYRRALSEPARITPAPMPH
ncbi:MAG TPA: serine/threonine-protein kinase [Drouetiella sp.]